MFHFPSLRRRRVTAVLAGILVLAASLPVTAETKYPTKQVRVVVGFAPGGNAELHEGSLRFFRARYPTHTAGEVLTAIGTANSAASAA